MPFVSYQVDNAAGVAEVKVAHWDGATWQIDVVDVGELASVALALDPATELPSISYRDTQGSDKIMFARKVP